jgi:hypothetical protein
VTDVVTLAVPCRTDEPALGRTLELALASWRRAPQAVDARLEVLVCVNGEGGAAPRGDLRVLAERVGTRLIELEADGPAALPPPADHVVVVALSTPRAGKPIAWNVLRARARGTCTVFADADVSFTPDAVGRLLAALAAAPHATLASAKTTCAARPGVFEAIMAAPYGVDFPNLSAQLYAARTARLPRTMPHDLIEPERWLELVVGRDAIIRVPEARVVVRLPGTLGDFFRQRIRIEMGKVQLARDYPGLDARGTAQPRARVAVARLTTPDLVRLAVYLGLRSAAHAVAWWRYRRGETTGVWRQAATTKRWDDAA